MDWNSVYRTNDINAAQAMFYDLFTTVINRHAPFKSEAEWITDELLRDIDAQKYCMRRFKRYPTAINWPLRQESIRLANYLTKSLQREYVRSTLAAIKGNAKETRNPLKDIWPLKSKYSEIKHILFEKNTESMGNITNKHFPYCR